VLVASRPKSIREAEKIALVDRVEHLDDRALQDLVLQRGDPKWPLSAIWFRDVNTTRRLCSVRPTLDACVQVGEASLDPLPVLGPRHAVDSGRCLAREREVCGAETIERDVMQERREPLLLILPCCFAHTVERTARADPALCPGHVLPFRVPLGRTPSLHPLLGRAAGSVRELRRYYEPV